MVKELLVSGKELQNVRKEKSSEYIYKKINGQFVDGYINDGWEIDKELKDKFKIRKSKSFDEIFENDVWLVFYNLGFEFMNKDRNFRIPYSDDGRLLQQIDVCAIDAETIVLIECKATQQFNKSKDFKKDLEAIHGRNTEIRKTLKGDFPNHKVKFLFATKNYNVNEQDRKRMKEFDIVHFDEEMLTYYVELSRHLGTSARYQLLGNLFRGQKIQGIENIVPAIFGEMGGHNYYSFSIEPEIILKLGYVLHQNNSNKDSMPTYQRIIKKNRLTQIKEFVNKGGYFPNSIIVSINSGKKPLRFDLAKQNQSNSKSKIGLLHLPQMYQSIYIIDGQHRVYGYSESNFKNTNTIPVVAFENLDKEEQLQIFMDVNENQKAVPKNLRNTLEENLNYESDNNNLNRKALGLRIARVLGEDRNSPLYERIIIGENLKTETRSITLESVSNALQKSDFFSRFDKCNTLIVNGTFDKGVNNVTFELLYPFLCKSLKKLIEETQDRTIVSNPGIYACVKICNDIINYLIKCKAISPLHDSLEKVMGYSTCYLKYVIDFWNSMSEEEYNDLKSRYGEGGKIRYWRTFEKAINAKDESFLPDGMEKYWDENSRENYINSQIMIAEVETILKTDIRMVLEKEFGKNWMRKGLPKKIYIEINNLATQKSYESEDDEEIDPWDCLYLINYKEIILDKWPLFGEKYTWPGMENSNKKERIAWFDQLQKIRNKCAHEHVASSADIDFLTELKCWIIK